MSDSMHNYQSSLKSANYKKSIGYVKSVNGAFIQAQMPKCQIGDYCKIRISSTEILEAQVVSFNNNIIQLAPFGHLKKIAVGAVVENLHQELAVACSNHLIGKVCNAFGKIIDHEIPTAISTTLPNSKTRNNFLRTVNLDQNPPNALTRKAIDKFLETGIAAIDSMLSIGLGQRIGLFASAGVGKSTLLGMITRNAKVDLVVIALIGERGREVNEFLEDNLGAEGRAKSIVVMATSDEPALCRQMAAYTATSIAEYFRDQGKNVLLLVDSLTRTARAIREVGLANGELPVRQGYPSRVYSELPRLLERTGNNHKGSITAIYAVLRNEENDSDPLAEEIISLLDGHIILSKELANSGIRPAIDILQSLSRLQNKLISNQEQILVNKVRTTLAKLSKEKDFLLFGGTPDAELTNCLAIEKDLIKILTQNQNEYKSKADVFKELSKLFPNN
jgi:flagellum-specific ATP synthase